MFEQSASRMSIADIAQSIAMRGYALCFEESAPPHELLPESLNYLTLPFRAHAFGRDVSEELTDLRATCSCRCPEQFAWVARLGISECADALPITSDMDFDIIRAADILRTDIGASAHVVVRVNLYYMPRAAPSVPGARFIILNSELSGVMDFVVCNDGKHFTADDPQHRSRERGIAMTQGSLWQRMNCIILEPCPRQPFGLSS